MSNLAELMNGRTLEHDFGFSNSGPMSGLVEGIQSISGGGATITLSFDETNTQLKCSVISMDPEGDAILKLPAELSDTTGVVKTLAGRKLTIYNSADGYREDITVQESDGTFIARVGFDACVEILFPAHGKPFCTNDVFIGTCQLAASGTVAVAIADAVGAGYTIVPQAVYITNTHASVATNSAKFMLLHGTTQIAEGAAVALGGEDTVVLPINQDETAATSIGLPANVAINMDMDTALGQICTCRLFYRVIKNDQAALS